MKCNSNDSRDTSMSTSSCSVKLKIMALVVNTADIINERTTPTLGISHAIISPVALFTSFLFLGIILIGNLRHQRTSCFLESYALIVCSVLHSSLSISVFRELKSISVTTGHAALVLNGVLPMIMILLMLADLVMIMFSSRDDIAPALPATSRPASHLEIPAS